MIEFKDEILNGEPRYRVRDIDGNLIHDNAAIEMSTDVIQEGTPLNKVFFEQIFAQLVPQGLICMWSGSEVPTGWYLCNGENGTPDLRNRFVVGAGDSYTIGDKGGSNTVTLSTANLPEHKHYTKARSNASDRTTSGNGDVIACDWYGSGGGDLVLSKHGDYDFTVNTSNTGSGTAHENRPPYYALAYIMKG